MWGPCSCCHSAGAPQPDGAVGGLAGVAEGEVMGTAARGGGLGATSVQFPSMISWRNLLGTPYQRLATLNEIIEEGPPGDRNSISSVGALLDDGDEDIRNAAATAMVNLANSYGEHGNRFAIDCLSVHLEHPDWVIRSSALQVLSQLVAHRGEEHAVDVVGALLASRQADVRWTGIEALQLIADRGDPRAVSRASDCLEQEDPEVRAAAVEALLQLTDRGDRHAVEEVSRRLPHEDGGVRAAAAAALGEVAQRGDRSAITALAERMEDSAVAARTAAAGALCAIGSGDPHAIGALGQRLEHPDGAVRGAVVRALVQVAGRGDPQAVAAAASRLGHPDAGVRGSAVRALGQLAARGEPGALTQAMLCLEDDSGDVRAAAVDALGHLCGRGDQRGLGALLGRLEDLEEIRWAAVKVIGTVAARGDCRALEAVCGCTADWDEDVRIVALEALVPLAEPGSRAALAAAEARLEDGEDRVRRVAAEVLQQLRRDGVCESAPAAVAEVKRGRFDFAPRHWARVSSGATALVARLLSVDPRARLTAAQALGDAWLGHGAEAERAAIPGGLVESLRRFSSRDALSKAALHVAAGLLEDAEVRPMRSAFLALDADGDGRLTPAKLREGLAQGDRGLSEQELAKIWGGVDVNGNGTIDYTEFLASTMDTSRCSEEAVCRHVFDVLDWDGDGHISRQDLACLVHSRRLSGAIGAESQAIFEALGSNGDASLSMTEFKDLLSRL